MKPLSMLAAIFVAFAVTSAFASNYKLDALEIVNPWSRATPRGATNGVGYMTIKNTGTTPDRLVGGSIDVANDFQIHRMTMDEGISKMRELKSGIEIKSGETVELKPGSSHVMFVNLKRQLRQHEVIEGTLVFEKAGAVKIEYIVGGIGAQTGEQNTNMEMH
jgi:periplasmic copper chaperone A